jgi:hypothetical protein
MIIYRVQDQDGRGPWKPGFSNTWVEDHDEEWLKSRPAWWQEFGMAPMHKAVSGMVFGSGCVSVEQLRHWFSPTEYQKLKGFGYQAVKLEVGRILAQSGIQVVFERARPLQEGAEPIELYDEEKH